MVSVVNHWDRELGHAPLDTKTAWYILTLTPLTQGCSPGRGGPLGACRRRRRRALALRTLQVHPTLALKRRAAASRGAPARRARTCTGSPGTWGARWERDFAGLRPLTRASLLNACTGDWADWVWAHVTGACPQLASSPMTPPACKALRRLAHVLAAGLQNPAGPCA